MLKFIPRSIIDLSAKETGVDVKARTYSVLSHLGTMLFVQLAHALSLNDVCDWLRLKTRAIAALAQQPLQLQQGARREVRRAGLLAHAGPPPAP
mgnify:CR=1 FL=1